jgi:hypothetical protein
LFGANNRNGTDRQDLGKIGKHASGMRAEPFSSRDGRLQVKEMTLTSRAACFVMTWPRVSGRYPSRELSMSRSFVCEEASAPVWWI